MNSPVFRSEEHSPVHPPSVLCRRIENDFEQREQRIILILSIGYYFFEDKMKFPFNWLLLDRWYWITVLGCFAVLVGPLVIVYLILLLPATAKAIAIFGTIIGWGIASGYKDWAIARHKDEKPKSTYICSDSALRENDDRRLEFQHDY